MQNITPHLWFDTQAREAAELYVSIFPGSRINTVTKLTGTPSGDCDLVTFELAGAPFMAISAGPYFTFNPSISFHVNCETNEEVDAIWQQLYPGGKVLMPLNTYPFNERYGWLEDRFGLSWQILRAGPSGVTQKITPVLMYVGDVSGKAEEAVNFYASVFTGAPGRVDSTETNVEVLARYGEGEEPDQEGTVRFARFSLLGQQFGAMDSAHNHQFAFNEAVSLLVPCDTQEEIDYFWEKLSAVPAAEQCGWLKDKYGVSWQIAPAAMQELLSSADKSRIARVTNAFLKMKKFDLAALNQAADGDS